MQAATMDERRGAAAQFVASTGFEWPLVCDGMDNEFNRLFGAWPTRFYVVEGGRWVLA
jgi:hypothetical protein